MRYAIVVEKTENNYSAYVRTCLDVSPPASPSKKPSAKFVKQSNFTSRDLLKTACPSRNRQASLNTLKSQPDPAFKW